MQFRGRPSDGWSGAIGIHRWTSVLVSALLVVATVGGTVAFVTGTGMSPVSGVLAQSDEEDFAPPDIESSSAERIDMETIELVVSDNSGIDSGTIDRNDFEVTPGEVVGVSEVGGGRTEVEVQVQIKGADRSAVTISNTTNTRISDVNGNVYTGEFEAIVEAPEEQELPRLSDASLVDAWRARQYEGQIEWPDDRPGKTTLVELYLTDNNGIDTTTIDPDDFFVSRSRITDVVTKPDGENAYALLVLSRNLDQNRLGDGGLRVGLDENATIRNTKGRVGNSIVTPGPTFTLFNEAPRFANASRVNDTAVQLMFTDDTDVAETSIQKEEIQLLGADLPAREVSEFGARNVDPATLREYPIDGLSITEIGANASDVVAQSKEGYLDGVAEVGSNASVLVRLPRPIDDDELLARVKPTANIVDTIGARYDPADEDVRNRYLIHGMDGVPPEVESFSVTGTADGEETLSLTTSERLAGIDVSVEGSASDSLDESDFTFDESEFTYEATYSPDDRGSLVFRLNSVTDDANNTRRVDMVSVRNGSGHQPRPDPVIALDFEASENRTFVFDGRHTSGPSPITNYTWEFGDGTSDQGLRVTKRFDGGSHLVALTVTDSEGQSATDTATLDQTTGDVRNATADQLDGVRRVTPPDLQVVGSGDESSGAARIVIRNPSPGMAISTSERLQNGEPLAAGDDVSVDDVRVVPARYDDLSLAVSATGVEGVDDTAEVDGKPVGSFSVEHDAPDTAFESATLSTSVDAQRLDELNATSEDVAVLRRNDGNWERLPTSSVSDVDSSADGTIRFRAETPGFSKFAVVAIESEGGEVTQPDDLEPGLSQQANAVVAENVSSGKSGGVDSQVHVRNATLAKTTVSPGAVVLVNATIENRGDGNTQYTAGLSVNDTVVVTEPVTLPAGEERTVSFEYRANETGTVPVAVNGTSAGTLTVSGGGVLSSVFGPVIGLFGFLPLGLLRPVVLFAVAPVLVVFLILKGLAIYLGY